jgi:hypothetical protein
MIPDSAALHFYVDAAGDLVFLERLPDRGQN